MLKMQADGTFTTHHLPTHQANPGILHIYTYEIQLLLPPEKL
jgi:hypothetical protein